MFGGSRADVSILGGFAYKRGVIKGAMDIYNWVHSCCILDVAFKFPELVFLLPDF